MSFDSRTAVRRVLLLSSLAALLGLAGCFRSRPEVIQTPITIAITTNNFAVGIGESATITAVVYDQNSQGVQWSASPLNFGTLTNQTFDPSTLTATVTYIAPSVVANPTKVTVTATSITNPNIAASLSFRFTPITISLQNLSTVTPLPPLTVNPNDQLSLYALVSNDLSNLGVTWSLSPVTDAGSLSFATNSTALYTAPPSVSAATTVVVTATSVSDSSIVASQEITILPSGAGPNVVTLNVNGGPIPGHVYPNRAFTSVLLCNPGTTTCQTVNGILVDTGSYGLRVLQSAIPLLKLPTVTDQIGNTLENCASWPDGSFFWGPVSTADLYMGQEGANLKVQVINSTLTTVPEGCSNGATTYDYTPELLGANGILGIGPEPTDCTVAGVNYCDGSNQSTPPSVYYACPSAGCRTGDSPVLVNALLQVSNPIPFFFDSNGAIIQLPAVADPQASTIGTMTFGIGTESNNRLNAANIFTLDANDNFTTTYNGQTLTNSFLDSGQNALRFPDTLPVCSMNTNYYCPASPPASSSAMISGATQGQSTVTFNVDNADDLFSTYGQEAVFSGLAGPQGTYGDCSNGNISCVFAWGFPFFYGRTVYVAIDGQNVQGGPKTPWWAF